MNQSTKQHTTSSSPSDTGLLRQFYEKQLNGSVTLLQLRYHVWTEGGFCKDAYWEQGGTRVFSLQQIKARLRAGTLAPADIETARIYDIKPVSICA